MSSSVATLEQRLSESIGDYIQVAVTTAIAANTSIISTNLQSLDGGRDDYFIGWFCYITTETNAGVLRQISDYATATGTLTVRGAALSSDTAALAVIRLHRYDRDKIIDAMNDASMETYPHLHAKFDIADLVTGNALPNGHFTDWAVSTVPDKYTLSNVTAVATTTSTLIRGSTKSCKLTASAGNGYLYITSYDYPKLLDFANTTVNFRCWAYPEVANDATLVIYTIKADGTTQTLTSTTTCPAGKWTLLTLNNQGINAGIVEIQFRFKVTTNTKYVYIDNARVNGGVIQHEYLMPTSIKDGHIDNVYIQNSNYSPNYACDDLVPQSWRKIYSYDVRNDGTDRWLILVDDVSKEYLIRLEGTKPLSTVSAYTDTIEIDGKQLQLWLAYAKYVLFKMIKAPLSSEDRGRYQQELAEAYGEYLRLLRGSSGMARRPKALKLPVI